jgi:hypothetical protein
MPRFSDYSGSTYMKAIELPMGKRHPAIIRHVVEELVGRDEEAKLVVYLSDPTGVLRKPIVLNQGNRDTLMAAFGDNTDGCAGKRVEVWTELVALGSKMVPGFKFAAAEPQLAEPVRPAAPDPAPQPGNGQGHPELDDEIPF